MKKNLKLNQKVVVFDQPGRIADTTDAPDEYGVTFDATGKTYAVEVGHIEIDDRPVDERLQTLEDCIAEIGEDHPAVIAYRAVEDIDKFDNDIIAFMKLRIIAAAYNEGWEPKYTNDEVRYYPWLWLLTEEEYNNLDNEQKTRSCRVVGRSHLNASAYGGLVYAYASHASSYSYAFSGSRLAFSSREKALSAARNFTEIFADFLF